MKAVSGEPDLQAGKPALRSVPPDTAAVVSEYKTSGRPVAYFYSAEWPVFTPPLTHNVILYNITQ